MLKESNGLSIKCRNLSAVAIVCVVAIHSNVFVAESNAPCWMQMLCDILFGKLTCWAVPFFFASSGYWFGVKECVKGAGFDLFRFYSKKFRALFVPYVFFVLLGLVSSIPLAYMQGLKHGDGFFSHMALSWDVLGVTQLLPNGNGPMWYLRTLIFLFALAPMWRILAMRSKWLLIPIACMALISPPLVISGVIPFRLGQCSFFFLGLFISQCKSVYYQHRPWISGGLAVLVVASLWRDMLLGTHGLPVSGVFPYVMLGFVWMLYDGLVSMNLAKITRLSRYVFWIFGVHMVFLNWMLPLFRLNGNSHWSLLIMTLVAAVATISLSVASAMFFEKTNKSLYDAVVGGR